MTDFNKWKKLMESIESPMVPASKAKEICDEMVGMVKQWCGDDCSDKQIESVLWATAKAWGSVAPKMKEYVSCMDREENNEYEPEHEGVEESASVGASSAGAIASGVQEATGECNCRKYDCKECFPEKVDESQLGWLKEAPDDEGPDDHVGREGTDVDFDAINKQGGVDDLGSDVDLKHVEDEIGNGQARGESEDVSSLIADIEEYQGLGISKAKREFDINQLHQMPVDMIKRIHSLVCGEDDTEDSAPDVTHESMIQVEEAEVKDIIESYRKLFKRIQ